MPNVWLGLATTGTRFEEGEALLIYDHAPNGAQENKVFCWIGPYDLTQNQIDMLQRVRGTPLKKLTRAALLSIDPVYFTKALDPTQYVAPGEIIAPSKAAILAAVRDTGKTPPPEPVKQEA